MATAIATVRVRPLVIITKDRECFVRVLTIPAVAPRYEHQHCVCDADAEWCECWHINKLTIGPRGLWSVHEYTKRVAL